MMMMQIMKMSPAAKTLSPFGCRIGPPDRGKAEDDFEDDNNHDFDADDFGDEIIMMTMQLILMITIMRMITMKWMMTMTICGR